MVEQAELTRSEARDKLQTVNPATGEPGRAYNPHTINDARTAAAAAHRAFLAWRRTSFAERSAILHKTAQLLRIDLTRIIVEGRPFSEILGGFAGQLKSIRTSLENRDYVALCDSLEFETTQTSGQWKSAIEAIREVVKK